MIGYNYVKQKKCNSYIVIKKIKMKIVNQIVKKVMPKLRGIETRGKGEEVLKNILNILLNENFSNLDKDFKFAKEQGFGQFVWGSAYYLNEGEFELSSDNNDDEIEKEE